MEPELRCDIFIALVMNFPGPVGQSVASPFVDPGVVNSIPAWPHTFVEIDDEIFSTVSPLLPLFQGLLLVTSENVCTEFWLTA